jgi:hypothetical protein
MVAKYYNIDWNEFLKTSLVMINKGVYCYSELRAKCMVCGTLENVQGFGIEGEGYALCPTCKKPEKSLNEEYADLLFITSYCKERNKTSLRIKNNWGFRFKQTSCQIKNLRLKSYV